MDLVAYGETFDSACEALKVLVLSQISFALFKGNLDLLWHPAPAELFTTYNKGILRTAESWQRDPGDPGEEGPEIGLIHIPPAHVLDDTGSAFESADV